MPEQDPALQPEVVDTDDNATPPPVVEDKVESAEAEEKPQDTKPEPEPEPEVELLVEGEEPPPEKEAAPSWVKDLRKEHRELKARNAELERALKATEQTTVLGPKPTLDGCDYDAQVYEQKLEEWHARRQEVSQKEAAAQAEAEKARKVWNDKLMAYGRAREDLAKQIPTFSEAEAFAQSVLDLTQQGVIVSAADNPALVVCALGQNPKLAQDLANEKDPIRFAFKVAKLEARLKVTKRTAPPPEKPVKGTGSVSGSVDSQLERLRAEAERTGDFSKVIAYKQQSRRAGK